MSVKGFTITYNNILKDTTLSLSAKGLYIVIQSFIGLKQFILTKANLQRYCSDSTYLFEKSWKELKNHGYLNHFISTTKNGSFAHSYILQRYPKEQNQSMIFTEKHMRNGSLEFENNGVKNDYTTIPNTVVKDKNINLAIKALYAIVCHLLTTPGFVLRPQGVMSFCKEKLKKFTTLWRKLKLSGLLKQHRFSNGKNNQFAYSYDLCKKADLETPYLTNYKADGTVSTSFLISDYIKKITNSTIKKSIIKIKNASQKKKKQKKEFNADQITKTLINYDKLILDTDIKLLNTVTNAAHEIIHAEYIRVKKIPIHKEKRKSEISKICYDSIKNFIEGLNIDLEKIEYPEAYIRTSLFRFLQNYVQLPPSPLSEFDKQWVEIVKSHKKDTE